MPFEPDDRAVGRAALRRDDLRRLAFDVQRLAARERLGALARPLDEERPVEPMRASHAADHDEISSRLQGAHKTRTVLRDSSPAPAFRRTRYGVARGRP